MKFSHIIVLTGGLMVACSVPKEKQEQVPEVVLEVNPPAKGFNLAESDQKAIDLADEVMEAMGGRENWNNTRYLAWNFFGSRKHLWDKWTGDIRIESQRSDFNIAMNIKTMTGKVWKDGAMVEHPDSLAKYLESGKNIWINDSYWLVMPYKLKDSGVTLKYLREDSSLVGKPSQVVQLTFQEVGHTPDNKYEVWIDNEQKLVTQWAYFQNYQDTIPRFTLPWNDWGPYGNIQLSGNRGNRELSDIAVLKKVPDGVFDSFDVPLPGGSTN